MDLLSYLNNEEWDFVINSKFNKDKIIAFEGSECEFLYILNSGKVKIASILSDGKEIIYNLFENNGIFGNNLLFSDNPLFKGDVVVVEDSEISIISKKNLLYLLSHNEDFLLEYLKIQSNFGKTLNTKIKMLSMNSAEERFLYYLKEHNNKVIDKKINDIALELNLERETLSRLVSRLIKENKILKNKKDIYLK